MKLSKQQKQVLLLYTTSVLGVLIGILVSILNTRSLPPNLYGNVRYIQNIITFISSLLLVGYFVSGSRLLALSKDEQYSRRIRGVLCVILAITISIVMLSMLIMYVYTDIKGTQPEMLNLYLIALPFCGTVLMKDYVNTTAQGDNHIGRIALGRFLPSTVYLVLAFVIFRLYGSSSELMLFLYNGTAFVIFLAIIISTKPSFKDLKSSFRKLREENSHYGFNVYLGSLAAVSTGYIAGITLGWFCEDNSNVGFYTLSQTMAAPLSLLPSIIGTTYFKRFALENRINKKVLYSSILLTVLSCLFFALVIKYVVMLLYNEDYYCVADYASWLVIGTCLHGLGDMFNRFLGAHGLGKQIRNGAFACGVVLTVGSIVLVYFYQIEGAIITRIISSMVYLFFMFFYYLKFTRTNDNTIQNDSTVG